MNLSVETLLDDAKRLVERLKVCVLFFIHLIVLSFRFWNLNYRPTYYNDILNLISFRH